MAANPTNLRSLDLNLMTVFEAVFETGSVVRAGTRLGLSQSATSHALGRLREACGDDLFVRINQGVAPTPVAQRIFPEIKRSLDGFRRSIAEARGFDPATSNRTFRIAIPHPMGPFWALALQARIAADAPDVSVHFITQTIPSGHFERMREGDIDLAIDWMPADGDRFVMRPLFDDRILFLARRGHPRATPGMDAEAMRREAFLRPYPRDGALSEAVRQVRALVVELDFNWALDVSEFLEVPFVVMTTDLLGFLPASMSRVAMNTGLLDLFDPPVAMPPIPIYMVWHETRRSDDGHRWLRDLVAETVIAQARA